VKTSLALVTIGILGLSSAAEAVPRKRPVPRQDTGLTEVSDKIYRAGVDFGLGIPTSSDSYGGLRVIIGADFYLVHDEIYDFGVSYTTGGKRLSTGRRWRTNFAGGELNYKMPNISPNFYVGASAGIVSFDGGDAFLPGIDDLYFGPKLGFFRMINTHFSWGLEGKLLFVTSSPFAAWIDLLGSIHYHF
jgi:hypothetical protein